MMDRVALNGDLSLSRLVYGMWRIGEDPDRSPGHVRAKIDACLEQGITTIDQADIYGGYGAEAILGHALRASPGLRDRIEIVTKCGIVAPMGRHAAAPCKHYDTTGAHIRASVEASLRALGTERVDLLLIHRPDPLMDPDETGPALDALVTGGKVRAVGVSNFRPYDIALLEDRMLTRLATNQIEVSLAAPGAFTNGDLAFHQRRRDPVMAWSPLGGGRLMAGTGGGPHDRLQAMAEARGVDPAAVAVAFLLRHPARILPVLGTNSLARIRRIADAGTVELSRTEWFQLYEAALGQEVP